MAEAPPVTRRLLPPRYQRKDDEDGPFLTCVESSNIQIRIQRGFSVSASAARKFPKGTIFLDGAAQAEPFMDVARGIYNLDHHEGCVRAFTLATCEQAMVMIRKGLDLEGERWTVFANEPDFDTVLAIWLLLNHRRVGAEDDSLRRRVMPMVRLQGVIDGHGFELAELTGFPETLQNDTLETINRLRSGELDLKKGGRWEEVDLLDFTAASLQEIDDLVYSPSDFEDSRPVEELARTWIAPQRFALACRSDAGIYEVEEQLRDLHNDRLGLVVLQKNDSTYTLRQSDPFLPNSLGSCYERLNLIDPAVDGDNRWGGSDDIGGSPRATGTGLTLQQILDLCRWVFSPPSAGRRLATIGAGLAGTMVVMTAGLLVTGFTNGARVPGFLAAGSASRYGVTSLVLALLGSALCVSGKSRAPGFFGMRRPRQSGFLLLLPVTLLVALAGGAWVPLGAEMSAPRSGTTGAWFGIGVGLVLGVVGIELLIRGVLHGLLVTVYPIMLGGGRRFISVPNAVSATVYMALVAVCFLPPKWLAVSAEGAVVWIGWMAAAFLFGLICGGVRERWGSVWAAVILHTLTVLVSWAVVVNFF